MKFKITYINDLVLKKERIIEAPNLIELWTDISIILDDLWQNDENNVLKIEEVCISK